MSADTADIPILEVFMALLGIKSAAFHLGLSKDCLRQWKHYSYIETYPAGQRNTALSFDWAALLWIALLKKTGISWLSRGSMAVVWLEKGTSSPLGHVGNKKPGDVGKILEKLRERKPGAPLWFHLISDGATLTSSCFADEDTAAIAERLGVDRWRVSSIDIQKLEADNPWLACSVEEDGEAFEVGAKPQLKHVYFRIGKKHRLVVSVGARVEELSVALIP